jgi:predicted PurR-regulated permease PerM
MTKDIAPALLITVYLVLVGLMDNALKPLLMGRGLTTPMPVLFIGLLGGTLAHGIGGLFIGPIVLAVGWELMTAGIRGEQACDAIAPPERVQPNELFTTAPSSEIPCARRRAPGAVACVP